MFQNNRMASTNKLIAFPNVYNKLVLFFLANLTPWFLFAKNFKIKLHTKKFYIIFDILFVQVIFMSVNKLQLCIALVPILLNVDREGKLSKLKNKIHNIRFARKKATRLLNMIRILRHKIVETRTLRPNKIMYDNLTRMTYNKLVTIIMLSVQDWGNIHTHKNELVTRLLIVPNLTRMTTRMVITRMTTRLESNLVSLPVSVCQASNYQTRQKSSSKVRHAAVCAHKSIIKDIAGGWNVPEAEKRWSILSWRLGS